MNYHIDASEAHPGNSISAGELLLLREETHDLDAGGAVKVHKKFIPVEKNVRFTLRLWARVFGNGLHPDCSGKGWVAFHDAVRIRHRITHPKALAEFDISNLEMCALGEAYGWYMFSLRALMFEEAPCEPIGVTEVIHKVCQP